MSRLTGVIDPPAQVVTERMDVKQVFRNGWSHAGRVRGWAKGTIHGEFSDPGARAGWKNALRWATRDLAVGDALDMGTGPGTISQLWSEMGWQTSGLDFSPTMLATCAAAASEKGLKITLHEGDVESPQTHLGMRQFDVVSSRLVLFTLPHPGLAIRRWVKMLRPGGRLVLMGEDHPDRQGMSPRSEDHPKKDTPPGSWSADEQYKQALAQLDFMHHDSKTLKVVMEAAGVEQVALAPMEEVVTARTAIAGRGVDFRVFRGQPYMLVGKKPD